MWSLISKSRCWLLLDSGEEPLVLAQLGGGATTGTHASQGEVMYAERLEAGTIHRGRGLVDTMGNNLLFLGSSVF